jgi:FkbM family methyltransferase
MRQYVLNYILSRLSRHFGELKYQQIFQKLYDTGIYGMNYGNGAEFTLSGELDAIRYAKRKSTGQAGFVLFDVGANVGNYSKMVCSLFADELVSIHLFEPSVPVFRQLSENMLNQKNLYLNNKGLGKQSSREKLFKTHQSSGLSSLYKRKLDHFNIQMEETEDIEIDTLDEYCVYHQIGNIDFLKIDVEGHELGVLTGASDMLKNGKIRFIQFEMGGTNIDSRTYFQDFFYLLKEDYNLYRIVKDGLVKMERYREEQEIFLGINYLAELK